MLKKAHWQLVFWRTHLTDFRPWIKKIQKKRTLDVPMLCLLLGAREVENVPVAGIMVVGYRQGGVSQTACWLAYEEPERYEKFCIILGGVGSCQSSRACAHCPGRSTRQTRLEWPVWCTQGCRIAKTFLHICYFLVISLLPFICYYLIFLLFSLLIYFYTREFQKHTKVRANVHGEQTWYRRETTLAGRRSLKRDQAWPFSN